ncbi:histo-blood group ABO system transferase-like [Protopterus annectens]|uniref:histo-blood group ABO system transferase-like n=1 Tax=Protopterus annectens TaxID=7888 RepID=UPI001CF9DF8A|nr:histo-blood group ABO system transferase-like [Protopterus annectens]
MSLQITCTTTTIQNGEEMYRILKPPRTDVLVMTPWFAPIVWDGTFDIDLLDYKFKMRNVTIGLTVFAVKKYIIFLQGFIESAENYFMQGHQVNYYVFTDQPEAVPQMNLKPGRNLVLLVVQSYPQWQEISMHRMEMIYLFIQKRFKKEVDYLVCVDVDMTFSDHVGVEILDNLFGTLHPAFYDTNPIEYTYERRIESEAYIPFYEGDFYYAGGFFGGKLKEVFLLTKRCHEAIMKDKNNEIEAIWHDESHINKYFLNHKPTKILSPEYLWDNDMGNRNILRKKRFLAVRKNHKAIRS